MKRFEDEDQELVAVVRTLADYALALTLVVLMLVGTRSLSAIETDSVNAQSSQPDATKPALTLTMVNRGRFTVTSPGWPTEATDASTLAQRWTPSPTNRVILVEFPTNMMATELHEGLIELASAFSKNHIRILSQPMTAK